MQYPPMVLILFLSYDYLITYCDYDLWHNILCNQCHIFLWLCDCYMIFPTLFLSNNLKEKKKERNINIDLAILPSHNNIARYALEKASKIRQNHIILQTVMINLVMRTNILIKPLLRNYLHWVQAKKKFSHLEHN